MGLLIIIGGFTVLLALFMYGIPHLRRRIRAAEFDRAIARVGFAREFGGEEELLEGFRGIDIFERARDTRIANLARGERRGIPVVLFDLEYWDYGFQGGSRHYIETFAAYRIEKAGLPLIHACPRTFSAEGLDIEHLDFPEDIEFEKNYLVSNEKGPVREFFNPVLRRLMLRYSSLVVQARGEWVVVFRNDTAVQAGRLKAFLDKAATIFTAIK